MPKTLKDFIRELTAKAGIKDDDADLKAFIDSPELEKMTIPDNVAQGVGNSLLSVDEARNNHTAIKSHYFKAAWDGLDKTIVDTMNELGVSDEIRAEVMKETSSTKRAALLAKKLKAEASTDAGGKSPEEIKELKKSINALNAQLAERDNEIKRIKEDHARELRDGTKKQKISSLLASIKTVYDDDEPEVRELVLNAMIDKALASQGGVLDIDDKGNLVLQKSDGTNFHGENHVLLTPQSFVEQTLAKNKKLATGAQGPGNNQQNRARANGNDYSNQRGNNQRSNTQNDDNQDKFSNRSAALADQSLRDIEQAAQAKPF